MKSSVFNAVLLPLLCSWLIACSHWNSDESVPFADERVSYIEARSKHGMFAGSFGDVVILDIITGKKFYVTDDSYYDSSPFWSPDGNQLAFLSNRIGSSLKLAIKGVGGPFNICIFDLKSRKLSVLTSPEGSNGKSVVDRILGKPAWAENGRSMFIPSGNKLFEMSLPDCNAHLVREIKEAYTLDGLQLSPNGYLLEINYDTHYITNYLDTNDISPGRIGIYNLRDSTFRIVPRQFDFVRPHWLPNGTNLLFFTTRDSLGPARYEVYNYLSDSIVPFDIPDSLGIEAIDLQVISSGEIIGYARPRDSHVPNDEPLLPKLFVFNPQTRHTQWQTDEFEIADLTVYLPRPK